MCGQNSIINKMITQEILIPKVWPKVMSAANNEESTYVNGSIWTVINLNSKYVEVKFDVGKM